MCARLLQTLPKEYDHIYVTWHDLPECEKTWAKLSRRCINYELRLTGRDEVEAATVMISKTTVSAKSTKKNAGTGEKLRMKAVEVVIKKCYKCSKKGHIAVNCKTGIVCFKCNGRGHMSMECSSGGSSKEGKEAAMVSSKKKTGNATSNTTM